MQYVPRLEQPPKRTPQEKFEGALRLAIWYKEDDEESAKDVISLLAANPDRFVRVEGIGRPFDNPITVAVKHKKLKTAMALVESGRVEPDYETVIAANESTNEAIRSYITSVYKEGSRYSSCLECGKTVPFRV